MTRDELRAKVYWIVCPMCDEPKCIGRFNCPEVEEWLDRKVKEYAEVLDKYVADAILG